MKRLAILLPLLALAAAAAHADEPPAVEPPARFLFDGFELRVFQDAAQAIPPGIFSDAEGRHPDPPEGGAFRASCNVFLVVEGDRRVLVDAGNGAPRGSLLAQLREEGIDPAAITDVLLTHEHPDHVGGLLGADGAPAFPNATLHMWWPPDSEPGARAAFAARFAGYRLDLFADAASATNLPAGFAAEPAPGHTPRHCLYRKGPLFFVGDAFHAADLQIAHPEFCATWDQDRDAAVAVRRTLLERVGSYGQTATRKAFAFCDGKTPRAASVAAGAYLVPMLLRGERTVCGAHLPFPGAGTVDDAAAVAGKAAAEIVEIPPLAFSPIPLDRDAVAPTPAFVPRVDPGDKNCNLGFDQTGVGRRGGLFVRDAGPVRGLEWTVGGRSVPAVASIARMNEAGSLWIGVPDGPPPDRLRYVSDGSLINGAGVPVASFDIPVDHPLDPLPPPERGAFAWRTAERRAEHVLVRLPDSDGLRISDGPDGVRGVSVTRRWHSGKRAGSEWTTECSPVWTHLSTNENGAVLLDCVAYRGVDSLPVRVSYSPRTVGALVRADGSPVGPFDAEIAESRPATNAPASHAESAEGANEPAP